MQKISTIGIAGAGTMGAGIAQVTAQAGFNTILFDLNEEVLGKAKTGLYKTLSGLVAKGKMEETTKESWQQGLSRPQWRLNPMLIPRR